MSDERSARTPAPCIGRSSGFTLVEMLVAISVLALMSVLVFGALKLGGLAWTRANAQAQKSHDVMTVQRLLRETLERAYPALVKQPDASVASSFNGTDHALEFTALLPREAAIGGHHRVRVEHVQSEHEGRVEMSWQVERNLPSAEASPRDATRVALLKDVSQVSFGYFGATREDREPRWHNSWHEPLQLPRLIRIDVRFKESGVATAWPTLTVAPRIDVDSTCVFDALTRGCRGR